ncbi:MAG: hypothetical protein IIC67_10945 [Thaumarchaeota archaeon]|nr:hypothetical protein [Nitrososphaerota archaeon]
MVNLNNYGLETEPVEMIIKHPITGEDIVEKGKSPILLIRGSHTKEYRVIERKIQKKLLKNFSPKNGKEIDASKINLDEMEEIADERIIACIAGWKNLEGDDKKPLEFNQKNLKSLLDNDSIGLIIKEQVIEFIAERENFTKRS